MTLIPDGAAGIEDHAAGLGGHRRRSRALEPDGLFMSNGPGDRPPPTMGSTCSPRRWSGGYRSSGSASATRFSVARSGSGPYKLGFRPPRRQPARPGPGDGHGRDHGAQPRLRRRGVARPGHPTPFGVAEVSHVCLNDDVVEGLTVRDRGGRTGRSRSSTTGGGGRPARRGLPVRPVRRRDPRGGGLMPRRADIGSVLVIGSGPIVIGQACEFDYSGPRPAGCCGRRGCGSSW